MATTYIIQGKTGRYYIGSTDHFEQRMNQHQIGHCHTTKRLGLPIHAIERYWERSRAAITPQGEADAHQENQSISQNRGMNW